MQLCGFCHEPIAPSQRFPSQGEPLHRECGLRLVIGSVAHLERRCECYVEGSEATDPPHLTLRQAAIEACRLFDLMRSRN